MCQIQEPASIFSSGTSNEVSYIDLSDLPVSGLKVISLAPYTINDASCGWLSYKVVSAVYSDGTSFSQDNISVDSSQSPAKFDVVFSNLASF